MQRLYSLSTLSRTSAEKAADGSRSQAGDPAAVGTRDSVIPELQALFWAVEYVMTSLPRHQALNLQGPRLPASICAVLSVPQPLKPCSCLASQAGPGGDQEEP